MVCNVICNIIENILKYLQRFYYFMQHKIVIVVNKYFNQLNIYSYFIKAIKEINRRLL